MADLLDVQDTVSGIEGQVIITVNGNVSVVAEARNITTTYKKENKTRKVLGRRNDLKKSTGGSGEGKMTIFYGSSVFLDIMLEYQLTGRDTFFNLLTVNKDETSTRPQRRIMHFNCNIDEVTLAKLDADESMLEEDIPFTFERFEVL